MKHKSLHLFLLLMLLFPGCNEKELNDTVNTESKGIPMSFYASIESPRDTVTTKTALSGTSDDYTRKVLWESQDAIYVTNGTSYSRFTNKTEGNSETAEFAGTISQGSDYYAAFPYSMVTGFSSSSFQITLPSTQTYKADGIASDIFPMVAQCTDGVFSFMNLCGILVLNLTGTAEISSISFSGTDEDGNQMMVSGNATVSAAYSDFPVLKMASNANSQVVLDCMDSNGKGVSLNSSKATPFHIVLPAANYSGFTIVVKTADEKQMTISSNKSLSIVRSKRTVASGIKYESEYAYVDLGLSVKWATCNVGASKPEEYGDYYAWGETEPKTTYDWSTYKWCKGSSATMTKYCNNSSYGNNGFTDTKTTLDPEDDVAHVKWGGNWRMPTISEFEDLINNCTWTWTTQNGVNGYKVTSKKSGYTDR
ncbi:MAG: hypothetical protein J6V75_00065, partial [Bacteroidaceae bacterium]|nr:hypothetical protein [Bacteroidaceae bacterium]